MIRAALIGLIALLTSCAPSRPAAPGPARAPSPVAGTSRPAAAPLALQLGLPADAEERMLRGEVVMRDLPTEDPTELALVAGLYIETPAQQLARLLERGGGFSTDPGAAGYGRIDPGNAAADLSRVGFEAGETAEAKRLLHADPQVNLSAEEARRLQGEEGGPDIPAAASTALREVLTDRLVSYAAGGPGAIAPYARGQRPAVSPGTPMQATTSAEFALWDDHAPLVSPGEATGATQGYWWVKNRVESRPEFDLIHTAVVPLPDRTVYLERHFYALHSYNGQQNTLALVPSGSGTLVFAVYRTWTDELTGIGGALRRAIAQGRFRDEIKASLERLRKSAGSS